MYKTIDFNSKKIKKRPNLNCVYFHILTTSPKIKICYIATLKLITISTYNKTPEIIILSWVLTLNINNQIQLLHHLRHIL